ncbi:MAG: amidohydrolase family protein [Actinomycetota bacterium]|nr:amidohydrolase family protein [Actinomycetota bacterium]
MTRTILTNATFYTGEDFEASSGSLAIDGGVISEMGDMVAAQPGDDTIDLEGGHVIPGLMDAHCHLIYRDVADPYDIELRKSIPEATIDAVVNAEILLRAGFTTVRDVGSRGNIGVEVRNAVARGDARGPSIHPAGQILSGPGGLADFHPTHVFEDRPYRYGLGVQVIGPHEARATIRRQLKDGVAWIKVGVSGTGFNPLCPAERNGLSEQEFAAVMSEAKYQGVPVAAHAESAESVRAAAFHGAQTIEHGIYIDDESLELMVRNNVTLSPTLSMYRAFAVRGGSMGIPSVIVDQHKRTHERHAASVRRAHEAGVPIVAGGDAGLTHFPQGSCAEEVVSYIEIVGMSPKEALRTITVNIARLLGVSDTVGTIDVGKRADLLALRDDPLRSPQCLQDQDRKILVMSGGERV